MRIDQDRQLGLAEHVNEARRDDHAVRVNGALCRGAAQKSDGGDTAVANADVARVPGRTGAINDVTIADDQVVGDVRGVKGRDGDEQHKDKYGAAKKFWHGGSGEL